MVGLGETEEEVYETITDLRSAGCSILTIGQYLKPDKGYMEVSSYIEPEKFEDYRRKALHHWL
jgi:lipoic acid synthetase